jgi:hypothetical protein
MPGAVWPWTAKTLKGPTERSWVAKLVLEERVHNQVEARRHKRGEAKMSCEVRIFMCLLARDIFGGRGGWTELLPMTRPRRPVRNLEIAMLLARDAVLVIIERAPLST